MSKIYKRPMFRGGGKVSSYGNGIATGLADGGRVNLDVGGFLPNSGPLPIKLGSQIMEDQKYKNYLNQFGNQNPYKNNNVTIEDKIQAYTPDNETITKFLEKESTFVDDNGVERSTTTGKEVIKENSMDDFEVSGNAVKVNEGESALDAVMRTALERKKIREDIQDPEETNIKKDNRSAREKIAENKELFEEVMGGGKKAMIDDLSTMGLSFASKALKEGATTKSAFAEFFEDESKRPSRKSKISDAASNAAIQAYLTGEKSLSDLEKALKVNQAGIDYKSMKEKEARKSMTINDYVIIDKSGSTNKAIANGARKVIESNNLGTQGLQIISEEDAADPKLLRKENKGEVFFDEDSQIVFMVVDLGNEQYGKQFLYR